MNDEFPLLPATVAEIIPRPQMPARWITVGYWPNGGWWKSSKNLQTLAEARAFAKSLAAKGWVHITIFELSIPRDSRRDGKHSGNRERDKSETETDVIHRAAGG